MGQILGSAAIHRWFLGLKAAINRGFWAPKAAINRRTPKTRQQDLSKLFSGPVQRPDPDVAEPDRAMMSAQHQRALALFVRVGREAQMSRFTPDLQVVLYQDAVV
jgi:hypothetical protein